jgi:hypothetical protein
MAERQAKRSIADLVLREWCPFLVNRGPVSPLRYNTKQRDTHAAVPSANQVEPVSLSAVGLSLSQSPKAVIYLGRCGPTVNLMLEGRPGSRF